MDRPARLSGQHAAPAGRDPSVAGLPSPVLAFLADLSASGRSRRTVEAYELDLRELCAWLRKDPLEASQEDLRAFAAAMDRAGLSVATRARRTVAVRQFYRWLLRTGRIPIDPAADLEPPRVRRKLPHFLTRDEVRALLQAIPGDARGERDRAIVLLGLHGLRVGEVVRLDLGDLAYMDRGQIRLTRKGGSQVLKEVSGELRLALESWLRLRPPCPSPALFVPLPPRGPGCRLSARRIEQMFREYAVAAGISKPVSFHSLRHSIATAMADAGIPLQEIQDWLDHASPATTRIYARVSRDRLREALRAGMQVLGLE
jgi:integrase/recombinase XerD